MLTPEWVSTITDPSGKTVYISQERLRYLEYLERHSKEIVQEGVENYIRKQQKKKTKNVFGFAVDDMK